MLVFKCSKCGEIYRKNEVPNDEICASCGSYLKVVNIKDDDGRRSSYGIWSRRTML